MGSIIGKIKDNYLISCGIMQVYGNKKGLSVKFADR